MLNALNERLAATPVYTPNLSISATVAYPLSASTGISFSLPLLDVKSNERTEFVASIGTREKELVIARTNSSFQAKTLSQALSIVKQALSSRLAEPMGGAAHLP